MYKFAKINNLLDQSNEIWKEFNVEIKYRFNNYKNSHENFVEIIGSSKSVHNFYKELMIRKCLSSNVQNDNGDCFNDTIEWPPHYLK